MKSQLQLDELARQLMTQKKKDVIVDTSNVNFHANGDNTLHLAEIDEAFTLNDVALNQIATKIGLSKKYLDKINNAYLTHLKNNPELKVIYIDVSDLNFVESENHYLELLFRIKSKLGKSFVKFPD